MFSVNPLVLWAVSCSALILAFSRAIVSVLFPVCPVVVVTFACVSFSLCLSAPVSPLVLKTFCCVLCGLYYQLLSTVVLRDQMYCSLRKHQQIEKGCRRTKHSGSWIRHKNVSKAHKNKWIQKEKFTKKCNFLCVCFLLLYLFHFCCVLFCLHKPLLHFIQLSLCFFCFCSIFLLPGVSLIYSMFDPLGPLYPSVPQHLGILT